MRLEQREQSINDDQKEGEVGDIEAQAVDTRYGLSRIVASKERQSQTILMESHPEEDDDSEDQHKRGDAFFRLSRGQFLLYDVSRFSLLRVIICMFKSRTECVINTNREYQRDTCDGETIVISLRKLIYISRAERSGITGETLGRLQSFQGSFVFSRNVSVQKLVSQRRQLGDIGKTSLPQNIIRNLRCCGRRIHGTDVNGHIEDAKRRIAFRLVFRRIVQIANQDLQVSLKQTRTNSNQSQSTEHHHLTGLSRCRNGK